MRFSPRWFYLVAPGLGALAGLLYGSLFAVGPLLGSAIRGAIIGTPILLYERGLLWRQVRERVRQLATPLFLLATVALYIALIVAGNAVASTVLNRLFRFMYSERNAMLMTESGLLYGLAISVLVVFVFRVRDLIGPGVFANLLIGRYHRPISEERIFLFLDVVGSTAFAEAHGDLRAQEYLSAVFATLAEPVRRNGGSVDDYIGDLAMVTWPMSRGLKDARCVTCVFDVIDRIEADEAAWTARFGTVPKLRAALHGGSVVTAEVGVDRHKIAYFGDAVNVTSRIEALCRPLGVGILISQDLLGRLPRLPAGVRARSLGAHALRGRGAPLSVATLERGDEAGTALTEEPAPRKVAAIR